MKYTLTLHEEGKTGDRTPTGPVWIYRVGGMPEGQEAKIQNSGAPDSNDWQILRINGGEKSGGTGNYESAEVALAVLQKDFA